MKLRRDKKNRMVIRLDTEQEFTDFRCTLLRAINYGQLSERMWGPARASDEIAEFNNKLYSEAIEFHPAMKGGQNG